jgi:hypothetical protein
MFPDADAARVFSQAIDEDTMGRVDDNDELSIETYKPVKAWILQREVKLKLRKNTRSGKGLKNPDDMVYGVSAALPAEAPASEPAAAQGPDPWLSASADPWSVPPGLPDAAAASAAPAWPDSTAAWMSQPEWQERQRKGPQPAQTASGVLRVLRKRPSAEAMPNPTRVCGQAWRRDVRELQR